MKAILFVDDHEALARLSCEILERQGYDAECAFSASDALQRFDGRSFDLLVTDYCMEGMNGLELARALRARQPDLPVVIVSGYPPVNDGQSYLWLEKQTLFPTLLDKIKDLLGDPDPETSDPEETLRSA